MRGRFSFRRGRMLGCLTERGGDAATHAVWLFNAPVDVGERGE